MKNVIVIFCVLFLVSCSSEPLDGFDSTTEEETADSTIFPEAECGEVAIEFDGFISVLNDDVKAANDGSCELSMTASKFNDDGSAVFLLIRITNLDTITYTLEDYDGSGDAFCSNVRVYIGFRSSDPEAEPIGYSTYSTWGGSGDLTVSEFELEFFDDIEDFLTGTFEITAGLVGDPAAPFGETISLVGSFNKIPIEFFCGSPFC